MWIFIVAVVIATLILWSCCKVSGDCSREEEKEDGELKPCPFCGGEAIIRAQMGHLYISPIHKKKCVIEIDTWLQSSLPIEKQIEAWNRRAEDANKTKT